MQNTENLRSVKSANEERTKKTCEAISMVMTEPYESRRAAKHLDRCDLYVDYLTYLDICSSESSVTLNHPVTSLAESHSLAITTNGNCLTAPRASTFEDTGNFGKNSTGGPATSIKLQAEADFQNKLGQNERRDLQ